MADILVSKRSQAVTEAEAVAEVFLKAFKALQKEERSEVLQRLLSERQIKKDLLDIALIEAAKTESGQDVSIEEYRRRRGIKR
jgi:hypothetical protein